MFSPDEYQAIVEAAGCLERLDRGRIRLSGADRRSYLQGILTNDIEALGAGSGCYAAMLTPNGRMITDMRVLELGDSLLIDLDAGLAPAICDRFEQFIFSEDVVVADESASLAQFGVYGPKAAAVLAHALRAFGEAHDDLPDAERLGGMRPGDNLWVPLSGGVVVAASDDFGVLGFEVFVPAASRQAFMRALAEAGARSVSRDTVEVTRVEAGRPLFGVDMTDDTIPLEAGIEDRAISLTKGCYVGQEIIIRVLHRGAGRVARRLVGLALDGQVPARGDRIAVGDRETGIVTSAVQSPALGRAIALGYVRREHAEPGTDVTVSTAAGPVRGTVVALPFVKRDPPTS